MNTVIPFVSELFAFTFPDIFIESWKYYQLISQNGQSNTRIATRCQLSSSATTMHSFALVPPNPSIHTRKKRIKLFSSQSLGSFSHLFILAIMALLLPLKILDRKEPIYSYLVPSYLGFSLIVNFVWMLITSLGTMLSSMPI